MSAMVAAGAAAWTKCSPRPATNASTRAGRSGCPSTPCPACEGWVKTRVTSSEIVTAGVAQSRQNEMTLQQTWWQTLNFASRAVQWTATRGMPARTARCVGWSVSCRSRQRCHSLCSHQPFGSTIPCTASAVRSSCRSRMRSIRILTPFPPTRRAAACCAPARRRSSASRKRPALLPEARAEPVPGDPVLLPDHRAGTRLLRDRAHAHDRAPVHPGRDRAQRRGSPHAVPRHDAQGQALPAHAAAGQGVLPEPPHLEEPVFVSEDGSASGQRHLSRLCDPPASPRRRRSGGRAVACEPARDERAHRELARSRPAGARHRRRLRPRRDAKSG